MKLYKVTVSFFAVAESAGEAEFLTQNGLYDLDPRGCDIGVTQCIHVHEIPTDWEDVYPFLNTRLRHIEELKTCSQIMEEYEARTKEGVNK